MTPRGLVVPLTALQIRQRALYLAGEVPLETLDEHVRRDRAPSLCPTLYYLLKEHNGGKDPTAADPADWWSKPGSSTVNVTCDCIGGASWCGGWDRYQPVRFSHIYDGWINTDSMIMDARGPRRCFIPLERPEPGRFLVCASGSPGHQVGHISVCVGYKLAEWEPKARECWEAIQVVDVAARRNPDGSPARANRRTTGRGWYGTGALFTRSIMAP
jgi:hypothetical protein